MCRSTAGKVECVVQHSRWKGRLCCSTAEKGAFASAKVAGCKEKECPLERLSNIGANNSIYCCLLRFPSTCALLQFQLVQQRPLLVLTAATTSSTDTVRSIGGAPFLCCSRTTESTVKVQILGRTDTCRRTGSASPPNYYYYYYYYYSSSSSSYYYFYCYCYY